MVIRRGKYVCFLSVLPVAVTHNANTHFDTFCLTPVPAAFLCFMYYAGLF